MDDNFKPDFLKPMPEVFQADWRNTLGFSSVEAAFQDHYNIIAEVTLNPSVHNDIKVQFETAKNVLLYSFYAYRLGMVGLKQSFAAMELGLRRYVGEPTNPETGRKGRNGMVALLERAHAQKLFEVKTIKPHLEFTDFLRILKGFRNPLAHGSHSLFPPRQVIPIVMDCSKVLNQVYDNVEELKLRQTIDGWE